MAYTPLKVNQNTQLDVDEAMFNAQLPPSTLSSTKEQNFPERARRNLRNPVAGTIEGEESLPSNVAPLVYPNESTTAQESRRPANEKNVIKRVNNYLDNRAQARYVSAPTCH